MINWNNLTNLAQLETIKAESEEKAVLIFKHSTRCSISSMAKSRLERAWNINEAHIKTYYLDLLEHRDISGAIATQFDVEHQSPQVILIEKGASVYHASHNLISASDIEQIVAQ